MSNLHSQNNKQGFVLFVALLTASFLLAVGLGVSSLAMRGFQLTSNAAESIRALYAANAGIECALFWDIKEGSDPFGFETPGVSIQKAGQTINCSASYEEGTTDVIDPNNGVTTDYVGGVDNTKPVWFWLSFRTKVDDTDLTGDGPCVYVTIKKTYIGPAVNNQINTVVDAYGYNLHGRSDPTLDPGGASKQHLTCRQGLPSGSPLSPLTSPPTRVQRLLEATY